MADTYTSLSYHVVFSTKNRGGQIKPEIEHRVWEYVGGIARENKMTALQVGEGAADIITDQNCAATQWRLFAMDSHRISRIA